MAFQHNPERSANDRDYRLRGLVGARPQPGVGLMSKNCESTRCERGAVTGLASRSHYFWLGGAFTRFMERDKTRMPSTLSYRSRLRL